MLKLKKTIFIILIGPLLWIQANASYILIPMDKTQTNHLKAYGIAYWILENEVEIDWLLNFRGGSFMIKYMPRFENELVIRG
jgi:hypothetical protein